MKVPVYCMHHPHQDTFHVSENLSGNKSHSDSETSIVPVSSVTMPPGMVRCVVVAAAQGLLSVLLLLTATSTSLASDAPRLPSYPSFSRNDTLFEHLALHPDPGVGRVYVGGRNRLYQLDGSLRLELQDDTGPVTDSRECLPPVTEGNCPQAQLTSNHNKLLLVDPYSMELIACGSVNQGICQKRSLDSVATVLFSAERPVDTQYVAANDPDVSTVGLVVRSRPERQPVLFVGPWLHTAATRPSPPGNLAAGPRLLLRGDSQAGCGRPPLGVRPPLCGLFRPPPPRLLSLLPAGPQVPVARVPQLRITRVPGRTQRITPMWRFLCRAAPAQGKGVQPAAGCPPWPAQGGGQQAGGWLGGSPGSLLHPLGVVATAQRRLCTLHVQAGGAGPQDQRHKRPVLHALGQGGRSRRRLHRVRRQVQLCQLA